MDPLSILILWGVFKVGQRYGKRKATTEAVAVHDSSLPSPRTFSPKQRARLARAVGVSADGQVTWEWQPDVADKLRRRFERCSLQPIESPPGMQMYVMVPLQAMSCNALLEEMARNGRRAVACSLTCCLDMRGDAIVAVAEGQSMPDDVRVSEHFASLPSAPIVVPVAPEKANGKATHAAMDANTVEAVPKPITTEKA